MKIFERHIFKIDIKKEYIKHFNDYLVSILYPDIKSAKDYQ